MSSTEAPDAYPAALEAAWMDLAREATSAQGEESLERLRPSVERLSDLFTLQRPAGAFPDYLADPALLAAYGLFFFPQSWTRTGWAMAHATLRGWRPGRRPARVLDLGSGPGSCGLRAARFLSNRGETAGELHLVDHSAFALAAADRVGSSAAPGWTILGRVGDARSPHTWPEGSFDLILAGFVLNELGLDEPGRDAWLEAAASRLAPEGLLILIEPALRETAEPLRRLSDRRASVSPLRIGPEVDDSPCPMLGSEHWDHEVRAWQAPPATEFLNRKLHRSLGAVRFSQALFSDASLPPLPPEAARVVAQPQLIKGLFRLVLSSGGRLRTVEVPTRGWSKREAKDYAAGFERGDLVTVPVGEHRRLASPSELRRLGP
jgi:SAM-dependent methyltransferase